MEHMGIFWIEFVAHHQLNPNEHINANYMNTCYIISTLSVSHVIKLCQPGPTKNEHQTQSHSKAWLQHDQIR